MVDERMPFDEFIELVKSGKHTEDRNAVALMRTQTALKNHVVAELQNPAIIEKLGQDVPRLKALLEFPWDDRIARSFLYLIKNSRDVRDANVLTLPSEDWGGPFMQIFGQGKMWRSFLERNPGRRATIIGQLSDEFPKEKKYIEACVRNPSHGLMMTAPADKGKIWDRFLELTLVELRNALNE